MNKINKIALLITSVIILNGCATAEFDDINQWMKDQEKSLKGRIDPLPTAKTFTPIAFTAVEDPFVKKAIVSMNDIDNEKYAPNPDRRKEPLESYPLDGLKMIGSLYKDNKFYAIVRASDGIVHYVTIGNYIGSNYGKIIKLEEGRIILDERIRDSGDIWKQKETIVALDDGENKK